MTLNPIKYNCQSLSSLGPELVFTQDIFGNYHSFYWRSNIPKINTITNSNDIKLYPLVKNIYFESIERVLTKKIPEQCHCILCYKDYSFSFELIISPIILSNGKAESVLVMGNLLKDSNSFLRSTTALTTNFNSYQTLLTKIARKIRLTVDSETIWQKTLNGIGEGLNVSRCLLITPTNEHQYLEIKAEFCHRNYNSLLNTRFNYSEYPEIKNTILLRQPTTMTFRGDSHCQVLSILLVPIFCGQEFKGIIAVHQCDYYRQWNQAELELIQELADQVQTAIAHSIIYEKLEQANQEAKEASRLKSEFLASTSHELRTPLNGILGFLKLVLDDMADDHQEEREFIDQAYHSALHLLNLINDILDIAKIEAGKLEFDLENISLNQVCEDICKFAHSQIKNKNLYFNIDLPPTYDQILIYGDYQRLLQVMLNLVSNSLKFTHEGGIDVSAEIISKKFIFQDKTLPGMIKINVADTGIGVSLEKQDKLFQTFYQVDGSRTKTYGGTGLGLAISKRLMETMGGKISFYSMGEGLGSTVTLTIPLAQLPVLKTK